jgi:Peptidase A4 family
LVINNFPVLPGDVIYAYSAVGTKNGVITGFYYIANYNTRKAVSASLSIPKNTQFWGQSAEWIVERTEVNGSFTNPLPFYAYSYMDIAYAYRNGSNHPINYTSQANENITMVQGSTSLSRSYEQDGNSTWFQWLAYF